jgi:hypothetical protein
MAPVMFAETLVNIQHSMQLTPKSRSYTYVTVFVVNMEVWIYVLIPLCKIKLELKEKAYRFKLIVFYVYIKAAFSQKVVWMPLNKMFIVVFHC